MSQEIDVESDPFLTLLTEALRAGPGSPEWHQAVARLREAKQTGSGGHTDEYQLLIAAREHLEGGKEYRSVRAGAGFTRKLMQGIEQEGHGDKRRGLPTATLIAIASALVIVAVLIVIGVMIYPRTPVEPPRGTVEDLLRVRGELMNETAVARFDVAGGGAAGSAGGSPGGIPVGWRRIGGLRLESAKGLRPAVNAPAKEPTTAPAGGGIVAPGSIGPDESFAAEVVLRLGKPTEDTLFEFFVSTDPDFSPDRAKSSKDLVWLLQGASQKVLLSGQEQSTKPRPALAKDENGANSNGDAVVPVRILVNHDSAVVECDGQQVWAGPHGLPAAPRYVGVRFLRTGPAAHEPAAVLEIRVRKK